VPHVSSRAPCVCIQGSTGSMWAMCTWNYKPWTDAVAGMDPEFNRALLKLFRDGDTVSSGRWQRAGSRPRPQRYESILTICRHLTDMSSSGPITRHPEENQRADVSATATSRQSGDVGFQRSHGGRRLPYGSSLPLQVCPHFRIRRLLSLRLAPNECIADSRTIRRHPSDVHQCRDLG
jgi:hypothetical protein